MVAHRIHAPKVLFESSICDMLSETKKELLRKFVDFKCERCGKNEKEIGTLQIHRIQRGNAGGTYNLRNIKVCCKECHGLYHGNEFK